MTRRFIYQVGVGVLGLCLLGSPSRAETSNLSTDPAVPACSTPTSVAVGQWFSHRSLLNLRSYLQLGPECEGYTVEHLVLNAAADARYGGLITLYVNHQQASPALALQPGYLRSYTYEFRPGLKLGEHIQNLELFTEGLVYIDSLSLSLGAPETEPEPAPAPTKIGSLTFSPHAHDEVLSVGSDWGPFTALTFSSEDSVRVNSVTVYFEGGNSRTFQDFDPNSNTLPHLDVTDAEGEAQAIRHIIVNGQSLSSQNARVHVTGEQDAAPANRLSGSWLLRN